MRRLFRWLFRPLVRLLGDVDLSSVDFNRHDDGKVYMDVTDPFGLGTYAEFSPDDLREFAWNLIGMADRADGAEKLVESR